MPQIFNFGFFFQTLVNCKNKILKKLNTNIIWDEKLIGYKIK